MFETCLLLASSEHTKREGEVREKENYNGRELRKGIDWLRWDLLILGIFLLAELVFCVYIACLLLDLRTLLSFL